MELELAFTEERFSGIVDQWAEAGALAVQQRNLWLDLLFPFAYAGLLTGLLGMVALPSSSNLSHSWRIAAMPRNLISWK